MCFVLQYMFPLDKTKAVKLWYKDKKSVTVNSNIFPLFVKLNLNLSKTCHRLRRPFPWRARGLPVRVGVAPRLRAGRGMIAVGSALPLQIEHGDCGKTRKSGL